MKTKYQEIERRTTTYKVELRGEGDEAKKIVGVAAVFNQLSQDLGGFVEQIAPGAFDDSMDDADTRGLLNHDSSLMLGRNKTTMSLSVDDIGLRYEIEPPDTTVGRDTSELLERGDIDQSSFGFNIEKDHWDERDDGTIVRTILKVGRLWDVSPVTFPAYTQTDAAFRSLEAFNKANGTDIHLRSEESEESAGSLSVHKSKEIKRLSDDNETLRTDNESLRKDNESLRQAYDYVSSLVEK